MHLKLFYLLVWTCGIVFCDVKYNAISLCCGVGEIFDFSSFTCNVSRPEWGYFPLIASTNAGEFTEPGQFSNIYVGRPNCSAYRLEPHINEQDTFQIHPESGNLRIGGEGTYYDLLPSEYCIMYSLLSNNGVLSMAQETSAVACFPPQTEQPNQVKFIVYPTFLGISVVFLCLTFATYIILPQLRDLQGKCLMCNVASLILAYTSLIVVQVDTDGLSISACVGYAYLVYFWFLAAFFWLNILAFDVWRSIVWCGGNKVSANKTFLFYSLYGWGCPLIFLVTVLIAELNKSSLAPGFGVRNCWFQGDLQTLVYFYGPIAFLLTANLVCFAWSAFRLWRIKNENPGSGSQKSSRFWFNLYIRLFVVMGITWIFEVISFLCKMDSMENYAWFLTDVLNTLQGVFIFIIFVCRKRVLKALRPILSCQRNKGVRALSPNVSEKELANTIV